MAVINHIRITHSPDSIDGPTFIYLNGQKLSGVKSVKYEQDVDGVPTCTLGLYATADIESAVGAVEVTQDNDLVMGVIDMLGKKVEELKASI